MPMLMMIIVKLMKTSGACTTPSTTMIIGKTVYAISTSQNILEPVILTYSSLALHSNINFSVPYSSFWKNHRIPISCFPAMFLVNQKSMTTKIAMSSFMTNQLKMATKIPLKMKRPTTIALRTAWMMKPMTGLGDWMSACSYWSYYCYSFQKSCRSRSFRLIWVADCDKVIYKNYKYWRDYHNDCHYSLYSRTYRMLIGYLSIKYLLIRHLQSISARDQPTLMEILYVMNQFDGWFLLPKHGYIRCGLIIIKIKMLAASTLFRLSKHLSSRLHFSFSRLARRRGLQTNKDVDHPQQHTSEQLSNTRLDSTAYTESIKEEQPRPDELNLTSQMQQEHEEFSSDDHEELQGGQSTRSILGDQKFRNAVIDEFFTAIGKKQ